MEKKIILLFIFISLILTSCDPVVVIKIVNDTDYTVGVRSEGREEIIPPSEERTAINFLGVLLPAWLEEENQENIANIIRRKGSEFGVYITYLEENYHITPETLVYLMERNAKYESKLTAYIYYLNLSEIIGYARLQSLTLPSIKLHLRGARVVRLNKTRQAQ